jgi:hypothetical protein
MGDHYTILAGALEGRAGGGGGGAGGVGRGSDVQLHDDEGWALGGPGRSSPTLEDTRHSRSNVFREVACIGWQPHSPRYWEFPPSLESLPSEIGLFLAGGLYVAILKAKYRLFSQYNPAFGVIFAFMLVLSVAVSWGTSLLFGATDDSGERTIQYGIFYGFVMAVYLFSCLPAYIITRPAVVKFHEDMEGVVGDLAPIYRRFGRDLEYHRHGSASGGGAAASTSCLAQCVSCCDRESFVRIKPFLGEPTPEEVALANALWDPKSRGGSRSRSRSRSRSEAIKVTIYHEDSIVGRVCTRERDVRFDSARSYEFVQHEVDPFTWGAVAMQIGPFADAARPVRIAIVAVAFALHQVRVSLTDASTPWCVTLALHLSVVSLVAALYYPCGLITWCLVHVWGHKTMFDELRAAIERLSPLVEDRSGYRLRFEREKDGCWGGTAAYVYFEPQEEAGGHHGDGGIGDAAPATVTEADHEDPDPRRPLSVRDIV